MAQPVGDNDAYAVAPSAAAVKASLVLVLARTPFCVIVRPLFSFRSW